MKEWIDNLCQDKKKKGREEHLRKKSQELFCKIILHPLIIERK